MCCDNVLLASYLWDTHAIEVDEPTARSAILVVGSHGILMACVWLEHVAGGKIQKQANICGRPHVVRAVAHSLSEQSKIIMAVYKCSWVTIGCTVRVVASLGYELVSTEIHPWRGVKSRQLG